MKSKAWYIKYPADAYAMGPVRFEREVSEKEVRQYSRSCSGLARLPAGYECWTTTD